MSTFLFLLTLLSLPSVITLRTSSGLKNVLERNQKVQNELEERLGSDAEINNAIETQRNREALTNNVIESSKESKMITNVQKTKQALYKTSQNNNNNNRNNKNNNNNDNNKNDDNNRKINSRLNIPAEKAEAEEEDVVVVEYARDSPTVFGENYDLVSKWTNQKNNNSKFFHTRYLYRQQPQEPFLKHLGHHPNSNLPVGDEPGHKGGYWRSEEPIKGRHLEQAFQTSKSSWRLGNEASEATGGGQGGSTRRKGDKRRHVSASQNTQDQWKQRWTREGIFRGVSRCVDIPRNMSLCANIDYKLMRVPNLLQHNTIREIVEQCEYMPSTLTILFLIYFSIDYGFCQLFSHILLKYGFL